MLFQTSSLEVILPIFCRFVQKMLDFGTHSKSSGRQNTKWRPNGVPIIVMHSLLALSKNANTSKNAKWIGPSFFLLLFVRSDYLGSVKYIEKHQADGPSEIQWPPKGKPINKQKRSTRCFCMYLVSSTLAVK